MIAQVFFAAIALVIGLMIGFYVGAQCKQDALASIKLREYNKGLSRGRSEWTTARDDYIRTQGRLTSEIHRLQEQLRKVPEHE